MIALGHVNIRTDRLEATLTFYERVLGFRRGVAATNPDPAMNVWLYDDTGLPSIHVNALCPGEAMRSGNGGCLDHIAFNCPDRAAMTALLAREAIPYKVVETRLSGLVQYNLCDPNGIKVELTFGHELVRKGR